MSISECWNNYSDFIDRIWCWWKPELSFCFQEYSMQSLSLNPGLQAELGVWRAETLTLSESGIKNILSKTTIHLRLYIQYHIYLQYFSFEILKDEQNYGSWGWAMSFLRKLPSLGLWRHSMSSSPARHTSINLFEWELNCVSLPNPSNSGSAKYF